MLSVARSAFSAASLAAFCAAAMVESARAGVRVSLFTARASQSHGSGCAGLRRQLDVWVVGGSAGETNDAIGPAGPRAEGAEEQRKQVASAPISPVGSPRSSAAHRRRTMSALLPTTAAAATLTLVAATP